MKDPEEWINNLTQRSANNPRRRRCAPFQPDALLFPSTWPPLHVLSSLAMILAIRKSRTTWTSSSGGIILMQDYCIQYVLYEEWYRVFLREKRVVLGAVVSGVSFLAILNLVVAAFEVDGVAGFMLTPALLASLVSGWMNMVLYNERLVASQQRTGNPSTRR
jgi:tryptophan-rich sensory protein